MIDRLDIVSKAAQIRKKLGEDDRSPINIVKMAMNIDTLTLVFYPFSDNISGMCVKTEAGNCIIAINSLMSIGRQHFSLAHELYHMYFDDNMVSICAKNIGIGKDVEKKADLFASYFLMPVSELESKAEELAKRHQNEKLTLSDYVKLEQYFQVSHQAIMLRLKDSEFTDKDLFDEMFGSRVSSIAEMLGFDSDLYRPLSKEKQYGTYGDYINKAEGLLRNELISNGKYEELLMSAFRPDIVYGDKGGDVID